MPSPANNRILGVVLNDTDRLQKSDITAIMATVTVTTTTRRKRLGLKPLMERLNPKAGKSGTLVRIGEITFQSRIFLHSR